MPLMQAVRLAARALVAAGLSLALARSALAQDQPIALVHGLASNAASWQAAADRMHHDFKLAPQLPDLHWRDPFASQAGELDGKLTPKPLMAIGHSNGGLVAREWNRVYGRNNRIATLGSLHQGAPLAEHVINGDAFYVGFSIAYDISDAFRYYSYWEAQGVDNVVGYLGTMALYYNFNFWAHISEVLGAVGFVGGGVAGAYAPVLGDMSPARSQFLPALNSSGNLAREAQAMYARVGIVSQMPSAINQIFYSAVPNSARDWITVRDWGWAAALATYEYYENYVDPYDPYYFQLHTGAWRWAQVALDLEDIDAIWCALTGTLRAYYRPTLYGYAIACDGSDGIVPVASQYYPGGTRQRLVNPGPTHMREKQDGRTVDQLMGTLREDFVVPLRAPGEVARVVIPATASVPLGGSASLSATSYTIDNTLATNQVATWRSNNPGIVAVTASGATATVTGVAQGTALVIATNNGYSDTTTVTVTSATPITGVTISGPSTVYMYDYVSFTAKPTGGIAPFRYRWTVNGIASSVTSATLSTAVDQPRLTVTVTVSDAGGSSMTASKSPTVKPPADGTLY